MAKGKLAKDHPSETSLRSSSPCSLFPITTLSMQWQIFIDHISPCLCLCANDPTSELKEDGDEARREE